MLDCELLLRPLTLSLHALLTDDQGTVGTGAVSRGAAVLIQSGPGLCLEHS